VVPTAGTLPSTRNVAAKPGTSLELGQMVFRQLLLAARDLIAVAGVARGVAQQHIERQPAAVGFCGLQRQHPAADGARHGECGERPARRNGLVVAIKLRPRVAARRAGRHDGAHAAGLLADQPKPVAAEMVHVRVNGGDGRGHGHHGFDRVAAFGEDGAAGFDGGRMRRADDAAAMAGAVQVGHAAAKPRLRKSASALGSRPRNAL
jgi:hypothetical protein